MRANHTFKAVLVALSTGFVPAAFAADLGFGSLRGTQYGEPMSETHLWEGIYFGGFAGMSNGSADFKNTLRDQIASEQRNSVFATTYNISQWPLLPTANGRETNFGAFAGYNYQFDEIVLGFEADYTRMNLRNSTENALTRSVPSLTGLSLNGASLTGVAGNVTVTGRAAIDLRNVVTLRARAGYTVGAFMPFVTAGVALVDYKVARSADMDIVLAGGVITPRQSLSNSQKTRFGAGVAAGAGVDVAVAENFFLRGEWQFLHFPNIDGVVVDVNTVRAGAGVRF